jgi:hypothetical protein
MIKRIEFTLNLEDPNEAAIYHELSLSLRYRRGGAVIRQALKDYLVGHAKNRIPQKTSHSNLRGDQK